MSNDVTLNSGGREVSLPYVQATEGNNGYDISALLKETGDTTFDIGFANTAVCKSTITFIDGDEGILRYRGYPIEELAEHSTFLETAYLIFYGELPSKERLELFQHVMKRSSLILSLIHI